MSDLTTEYSSDMLSGKEAPKCNVKTDKYFMYMTKDELMKYLMK